MIELLVVVAIIAVLVSILLPALTSARESARGIVCASNLREIAKAASYYAEDSGYFPVQSDANGGNSYTNGSTYTNYRLYRAGYLKDYDVWYCPSKGSKDESPNWVGGFPDFADNCYLYNHNFFQVIRNWGHAWLCAEGNDLYNQNQRKSKPFVANMLSGKAGKPMSQIIMFADGGFIWGEDEIRWDFYSRVAERHQGKANVVCGDLHVERIELAEYDCYPYVNRGFFYHSRVCPWCP